MKKSDYNKKWKTLNCFNGTEYFCKLIAARDYNKKKGDLNDFLICYGEHDKIDQSILAQHIVKLHNEHLDRSQK